MFIRETFPHKPVESCARNTRRGAYAIEVSRVSTGSNVSITGGVCRWRGVWVSSPAAAVAAHAWQGSEYDPWYSQAQALGGQNIVFLAH